MARFQWFDSAARYGAISRALHWGMALLFAWQFAGMVVRLIVGRAPITAFMVGSHRPVGIILLVLAAFRLVWLLVNLRRRPPYDPTPTGWLALSGHVALYGLMLIVPTVGLLREYALGRRLDVWGIEIFAARPDRIEWILSAIGPWHGRMAWSLLALVTGHILMAMVHRLIWRDDVLSRMAGRARAAETPGH